MIFFKCLQEREEQIKTLQEKITEIQKCTQEQLDEKSSQLDDIVEKLERHSERKEKLKQQLQVKELELEEIRKAYRYSAALPLERASVAEYSVLKSLLPCQHTEQEVA